MVDGSKKGNSISKKSNSNYSSSNHSGKYVREREMNPEKVIQIQSIRMPHDGGWEKKMTTIPIFNTAKSVLQNRGRVTACFPLAIP